MKKLLERKEFIKKIKTDGKEFSKQLKEDIGKDIPEFYKARAYINEIPIFVDSETRGVLFLGGPGAGKTLGIFEYISSIINWSKKNDVGFTWIVYDKKQDYYTKMFRKDKDVLLFPKHADTSVWNFFREFHDITIDGNGNKIWKLNIKELTQFVDILTVTDKEYLKVWKEKEKKVTISTLITVSKIHTNPSIKDLKDFLTIYNTKEKLVGKIDECGFAKSEGFNIKTILADTEAGTNVYELFIESMNKLTIEDLYHSDEESDFSVKEFNKPLKKITEKDVKNLSPKERNLDKRLILVEDHEDDLYTDIYRIIIELQAKTVLTFEADLERRVFFLMDEVIYLGKTPCLLERVTALGRSKGAAIIIGIQVMENFNKIYGDEADVILSNFKTKVIMNGVPANKIPFFDISQNEIDLLGNTEGILQIGTDYTKVKFRPIKIKKLIDFEKKAVN